LQVKHHRGDFFRLYLSSFTQLADLVILAELAFQIAPGKKNRPAAQPAAQWIFFAVVRAIARNDGEHPSAAHAVAGATGDRTHLVSLVRHEDAVVLAQQRVENKTNEIGTVPELLRGRDLHNTVLTMDALRSGRLPGTSWTSAAIT